MALKLAGFTTCVLLVLWGHAPTGANSQTGTALFDFGVPQGDAQNEINGVTPIEVNLSTYNFTISYLGFKFDKLIISADGTVSFKDEVKYNENFGYQGGVRSSEIDVPFIAPLIYKAYRPINFDANQYPGRIHYRVVDYTKPNVQQGNLDLREYLYNFLPEAVVRVRERPTLTYLVVVTWENVADGFTFRQCSLDSPCNSTTFQVAITGNVTTTFVIFNYGRNNLPIKANYEAGFNAGGGRGWHNVLQCQGGCSSSLLNSGISDLYNFQGSDTRGRYLFSVAQEMVIRGGCLASEITAGVLEVLPRTVGMFGGEKLEVSGRCGSPNSAIYCRFGGPNEPVNRTVEGVMVSPMKGYCQVPLLTMTGRLDLYWSTNNRDWQVKRSINVVLPSRLEDPVVVAQSVKDAWNKRDSQEITVPWNPDKFSKDTGVTVDVKIIGYRESNNQVEYKVLQSINGTENRLGTKTFNVNQYSCTTDCDQFEIGLLEASIPTQYHRAATDRVAVRFGPIPLGWYVNKALTAQKGAEWSNQKCKDWSQADARNTQWLNELLPCPCSLAQALADFGRWQADPGCDLSRGSICQYHKDAKHCVRSVVPTRQEGAGNQCCYNLDGTLRHSQLSNEGSTPDRSHAWGSQPYNRPNKVPEMSHWKQDVVPFYYCCLWNKYQLCDLYMKQRPTTDCRNYDPPALSFVEGTNHFRTWDNLTHNFVGSGDYWLVSSGPSFIVHGKFAARSSSWDFGKQFNNQPWKPKSLTALAIGSNNRSVEVTVSALALSQRRGIEIRVDGESRYFVRQVSLWQDFEEFTVINNAAGVGNNHHDNFTILLHNINVGINVVAVNGLLQVAVAVPPTLKPTAQGRAVVVGLFGTYDGDSRNDFQSREGAVVSPQNSKREIQERFALTWRLTRNDQRIFRFEAISTDSASNLPPYLESQDVPNNFTGAPSTDTVNSFCGASDNCKYDYKITNDALVARATRDADAWVANLQSSASKVISCGVPEVGFNTILGSEVFFEGREVKVQGCRNGKKLQTGPIYRCVRETLADARQNGRDGYGVRDTVGAEGGNKVEYITHWVPKPVDVCSDDVASGKGPNLALIIGVSVGAAVAIIIIIVVVVIVVKKRKGKSDDTRPKETRTAAPRGKREVVGDPRAAEAMLSRVEDRSPVYKPSADQVRMSDVQGSNV